MSSCLSYNQSGSACEHVFVCACAALLASFHDYVVTESPFVLLRRSLNAPHLPPVLQHTLSISFQHCIRTTVFEIKRRRSHSEGRSWQCWSGTRTRSAEVPNHDNNSWVVVAGRTGGRRSMYRDGQQVRPRPSRLQPSARDVFVVAGCSRAARLWEVTRNTKRNPRAHTLRAGGF